MIFQPLSGHQSTGGTLAFAKKRTIIQLESFFPDIKCDNMDTHLRNGIVFSSFFAILGCFCIFAVIWISVQVRISIVILQLQLL